MEGKNPIALITGASSGIGRDMARYLSQKGYHIIAVARDESKLKELQKELGQNVTIKVCNLSKIENVYELWNEIGQEPIDILVNNAGFGLFGDFEQTNLEKELNMIQTNVMALHVLSKLYLQNRDRRKKGYLLNVSSIASFAPGPLMATYYATKAYVTYLTRAISKEVRKKKENVVVSVLCPGPVDTNFNNVAGVHFSMKPLSSEYVAKYAIDQLLMGKKMIIPGFSNKIIHVASKFAPVELAMKVVYQNQTKKVK